MEIKPTNNLKTEPEEYIDEFFMHMYVHITEAMVCAKIISDYDLEMKLLEQELAILYEKVLKIRTAKYGHRGDRWIRTTKE